MEQVKTILDIKFDGIAEMEGVYIDGYPDGSVVIVDRYFDSVELSRSSAIASARAILAHFGEVE